MTLDLEDEYGLDLGFDYEKTATEVINQVLETARGAPATGSRRGTRR